MRTNLFDQQPNPSRFLWIALALLVLALYGFVGRLDYVDQRTMECAESGKGYDSDADKCVKENTNDR